MAGDELNRDMLWGVKRKMYRLWSRTTRRRCWPEIEIDARKIDVHRAPAVRIFEQLQITGRNAFRVWYGTPLAMKIDETIRVFKATKT